MADSGSLVDDDVLRLVLMCAHPALAPESASALSLRLVLGVSTADIARLFLVPEPTMAARITRAKKRIVGAGIPFAVPGRLGAPGPARHRRPDRLPRLHRGLRPRHRARPAARRAVRRGDPPRAGRARPAPRRTRPGRAAGADAAPALPSRRPRAATVGWCCSPTRTAPAGTTTRSPRPPGCSPHLALTGPLTPLAASYVLQARIAAEHATAPTAADTRWDRIVGLYDLLLQVAPSPSARLARAVAVAEDRGAAAGLAALEGLEIPDSHRPAAVRAELLSPGRATSTPRGRPTTRRSRRAATTSSAPSSSGARRA